MTGSTLEPGAAAALLAGLGDRRGALRRARRADGGRDGPVVLPHQDKNFIPHEYPCRTRFAAERRGRRPEVRGRARARAQLAAVRLAAARPVGLLVPPDADRRLGARPRSTPRRPATARFRLATCGGAVLLVNGAEAGCMAPYSRNREASVEIGCAAAAGRRTRSPSSSTTSPSATRGSTSSSTGWTGPPARQALPFDAAAGRRGRGRGRARRRCISSGPAYAGGEVRLALPRPPSRARTRGRRASRATVASSVAAATLAGGRRPARGRPGRGPAGRLPPFPRDAGGRRLRRLPHARRRDRPRRRAGARPADLPAASPRRWRRSRSSAEPDTVTALARLATGRAGPATDAMIEAALGPIEDCWDCADFALVPLIWARAALRRRARRRRCASGSTRRSSATATGWTSRATTCSGTSPRTTRCSSTPPPISPGTCCPSERFVRSGRPGREQSAVGARAGARLARPFRALGDGRVQLRPLLPDRPQGPDRALRAGARRRHPRAGGPRHRAAAARSSPTPRTTAC